MWASTSIMFWNVNETKTSSEKQNQQYTIRTRLRHRFLFHFPLLCSTNIFHSTHIYFSYFLTTSFVLSEYVTWKWPRYSMKWSEICEIYGEKVVCDTLELEVFSIIIFSDFHSLAKLRTQNYSLQWWGDTKGRTDGQFLFFVHWSSQPQASR